MTEQYTPSDYDIHVQNPRIDQLESLVTAEYEPPSGVEYSFPVANQGITQEQFRLMNLGQANGMIHGDNGTVNDSPDSTGYRYYLEGHDSDSETNQRNTLLLRAGTSAESIVEGFYHRLTEDMELPFPAVTSTTLYRVTLTYDPRKFKTNPVSIEVWNGEPPTAHGQIHLLLHTVERKPNQLLSQATITRFRQYTAGVVSVQNETQLPDWRSVPAGTLAVPSSTDGSGIYVRSNTSPGRWANTMAGEWENIFYGNRGGWTPATGTFAPLARITPLGIQLKGQFNRNNAQGDVFGKIRASEYLPNRRYRIPMGTSGSTVSVLIIDPDGDMSIAGGYGGTYVSVDGIIIPHN